MPFINGFQGLVNGWIKVNSKHVVITNTTAEANVDVNSHASSRRGGKSDNDSSHDKSTFARRDPEITAIKKYNSSKRNRRKLERTVSLTDLLREMAIEKEKELKHQSKEKSSEFVSDVSSMSMKKKAPLVATTVASDIDVSNEGPGSNAASKDDQSIDSFRFVAGFFGADIPPPPPGDGGTASSPQPFAKDHRKQAQPQHQQQHLIPMGHPQHPRIINTNAKWSPTVAGHKQPHQYDLTRHTNRSSIDASMGDANSIRSTHPSDSIGSNQKGGGGGALQMGAVPPPPSLRGTPPLHPIGHQSQKDNDSRSKQSNPMQQFFKNLPGTNKRCGSCDEYESRLLAMAADMDYLRSQALSNEYTCRECRHEPSSQQQPPQLSDAKQQREVVVSSSSHRLAEMEVAHLEQMELLTRERSRGQQTMLYKLSKFATIAKDLNEESAMRKQEALKLEDDLMDVKAERDSMALELDQLRAAAVQHEVERMEHEALKEMLRNYEMKGLGRAKETVDQRDSTILDLASKLERAMGMVEIERMKQRQRRQIIFPSRASHPGPSASHPMPETAGDTEIPTTLSLDEQLRLAKEQAHIAQIKFELSQADAARTAAAFQSRVDHLERRLELAESSP